MTCKSIVTEGIVFLIKKLILPMQNYSPNKFKIKNKTKVNGIVALAAYLFLTSVNAVAQASLREMVVFL